MIRLMAATRSRYHSRVYFLFMSPRMRLLPLCTGRWICLHTFGTSAITCSVSSLMSFGWLVVNLTLISPASSATILSNSAKVIFSPPELGGVGVV